jgi:glyceraldehyde-3-phosphate dehydrogenase/erythrose-4-phosphate dehydrogenase
MLHKTMTLTDREKAIVAISNAISVYSVYTKNPDMLPKNMSMIDFILKSTPAHLKKEISIDLIDEIFAHVTKTELS